jgi:hypothetical protein
MKQSICQLLFINIILFPGELGVMTLVMYRDFELELIPWVCCAGIIFTVNVFITAAYAEHVEEQHRKEKQEERIENA